MSEIKTALERLDRRVTMPEPAMERLLRRRERRQRNERIAAAAVGLGVFAAGLVGAVLTLRVAGGTEPASGGGHPAAAEGGGLLLPTVAIWTAIVVLALTVLAAVRLRTRSVDQHADVEPEGRGPGRAAASARRPAAEPGAAPWRGGTEMDSKTKMQVGISQAEMPPIRFDEGKIRRTNRWLIGAVVVLAAVLVAVGTWAIVDRSSAPEAAPAPTPDPRTAVIDALSAAWSGADSGAVAGFYADNAVFTTESGAVYEGRDAIVGLKDSSGLQVARVSGVIGQRRYAAAVTRVENAYGHAYVLTVWKFNAEGKILSQQLFYGGS